MAQVIAEKHSDLIDVPDTADSMEHALDTQEALRPAAMTAMGFTIATVAVSLVSLPFTRVLVRQWWAEEGACSGPGEGARPQRPPEGGGLT